jgi:hypothetical protein
LALNLGCQLFSPFLFLDSGHWLVCRIQNQYRITWECNLSFPSASCTLAPPRCWRIQACHMICMHASVISANILVCFHVSIRLSCSECVSSSMTQTLV